MVCDYEKKAREFIRKKYNIKRLTCIGGGTDMLTNISDAEFIYKHTRYFCIVHTNGRVYITIRPR